MPETIDCMFSCRYKDGGLGTKCRNGVHLGCDIFYYTLWMYESEEPSVYLQVKL